MGNNNAYCQDNELAWMNWNWDDNQKKLFDFTKKLIAIRQKHKITHRRRYFKNRPIHGEEIKDIRWLNTRGKDMSQKEWDTSFIRIMGMLLNGKLMDEMDESGNMLSDAILLVLVNSFWEPAIFTLPNDDLNHDWEVLIDTSKEEITEPHNHVKERYEIQGRSLVLLKMIST
jgi:glycogen operon protein